MLCNLNVQSSKVGGKPEKLAENLNKKEYYVFFNRLFTTMYREGNQIICRTVSPGEGKSTKKVLSQALKKLDGVGPVDNRPSTD